MLVAIDLTLSADSSTSLVEEAASKVHAALETNDAPSSKLEPVLQG